MSAARQILGTDRALIGMVHAGALPGTPRGGETVAAIAGRAAAEARIYREAGFDAVIVENMHDVPYLRRRVGPEIVAAMTVVVGAVVEVANVPVGVQILAGANRAAVAVAHATGARFVRVEGFVFAAVADEGLLDEADAGPLLRYRRAIGAEGVAIIADVKKKHSSHALTADVSLAEEAKAAEFFGADGIVVTGRATGLATKIEDVRAARQAVAPETSVLVGSGVTPETVAPLLEYANGLIVGSWCKREGVWEHEVDAERAGRVARARV